MSNLRKWADEHQYDAEPQPSSTDNMGVMPTVHLLHMQEDPLGVLAAQNAIYKGKVVRSLAEVTNDERKQSFEDMMRTTLQSPLEAIKMHFLFEGVDRAFTHQQVRQRTANYGQESLRFAVMGELRDSTTLPPELHGTERSKNVQEARGVAFNDMIGHREFTFASQGERNRAVWDWTIEQIDAAYHYLAEHGVAAEEARGLLPHCTATRIHYQTDMRGLMKVMGERLCTQAQFHWRIVAALVKNAVRNYTPDLSWAVAEVSAEDLENGALYEAQHAWERQNRWQFEMIADSGIFQPVCYQTGKCMFQASADRGCTIRERVDKGDFESIKTAEWLMDPAAARKQS